MNKISSILGIRPKFDINRPINSSTINIFERDKINTKSKLYITLVVIIL